MKNHSYLNATFEVLLLAAALGAVGGCADWEANMARWRAGLAGPAKPGAGSSLTAWVASDMVNLTDQSTPPVEPDVYDPAQKTVTLVAGANETVSFQIVVDGGAAGVKGLKLTWADLAGPGKAKVPAANIQAFRMVPIRVSDYPAWYLRLVESVPAPAGVYDPLVPLAAGADAPAIDVPPNGRCALWLDLAVPRGTAAGQYAGTVKLTAPGLDDWQAAVKLDVYAFVLPDARAVPAVGGFDHRQLFAAFLKQADGKPFDPTHMDRTNEMVRRGLVLVRDLMVMAHRHRLDLFDTEIHPVLKRTGEGEVKLQWDDYDAIVTPYLKGTAFDDGIGCAAWPMPVNSSWPNAEYYEGASSEIYARTVENLLAACRSHFAHDVSAAEQMFLWPARQQAGAGAYTTHAAIARLARKADPNTPILCQLPLAPPPESGLTPPADFRKLVDIQAPGGELLDPATAAGAVKADHALAGVWLAPATPPYLPSLGVVAKPADVRAYCWFAMKYHCTGIFLPDVLHWSSDVLAPRAGTETRLFYPGTIAGAGIEAPLPSVRLKRLRRGLQDLAYLWILQRRQRTITSSAVMDSLVRYACQAAAGDNYLDGRLGGWVDDGTMWIIARRILAAEVQAVVQPETAGRLTTLEHLLLCKRLDERTHGLDVEQVRSIVRPAAGSKTTPPERLQMSVLLDVYNRYGVEADLSVEFAALPGEWKPLSGTHVGKLPAGARRTVQMDAEGPGPLPTQASARAAVPIRLKCDLGPDRQVDAQVPFLLVAQAHKAPTIDGLLNDWPLRVGNTARDFRLVGRRGAKPSGPPSGGDGLAARQTMVFLQRDAANLYLGFRCEEPTPERMVTRPNNMVPYEQLMACGEDLVEVMLDPGGKAAGPEGLFHLVIKPNGVLVSQRGVSSTPALGPVTPWSPAASVAIGKGPGAWTVELSIPLEAFGELGKAAFWRANFARFATQGAESSSWAGAPRYFYDPRNLGTVFVGAPEKETPTTGQATSRP
jgi:hypothetical protein